MNMKNISESLLGIATASQENLNAVRRYLFWISFDGSRFTGSSPGANGYSAVDFLARILCHSLPHEASSSLKFHVSSRTDVGVHCRRNSVLVQSSKNSDEEFGDAANKSHLLASWNGLIDRYCPNSLRVLDYHRYRVCVAKNEEIWNELRGANPPLIAFVERNYVWFLPPNFDIENANEACKILTYGLREQREATGYPLTMKHMHLQISRGISQLEGGVDNFDYYDLTFISRSFLREQIRRMMCAIVKYACRELSKDSIFWMLKNPNPFNFHSMQLVAAPPQGLLLDDVVYDEKMFSNPVPYYYVPI